MELKDIENESQRRYGMGYEELMTPEQDQINMNPAETKEDPFRKDNRQDKIKEWILRGLTKDQIIDRLMEGFAMNREDAEQMYLDETISGTVGKTMRILKGEKDEKINYKGHKIEIEINEWERGKYEYKLYIDGEYYDSRENKANAIQAGKLIINEMNEEDKINKGEKDIESEIRELELELNQAKKRGDRIAVQTIQERIDGLKSKKSINKATELPIYKIRGKYYYRDTRLNEFRNVKDPNDRIDINDVSLDDLETPTESDQQEIYGKSLKKDAKLDAIHEALVREGKAEDPWALAQWIRQHNKSWDDINKYLENIKSRQVFMEKENTSQDVYVKEERPQPKAAKEGLAQRKFNTPYDKLNRKQKEEVDNDYAHYTGENRED
jgi:hypothetical protein